MNRKLKITAALLLSSGSGLFAVLEEFRPATKRVLAPLLMRRVIAGLRLRAWRAASFNW